MNLIAKHNLLARIARITLELWVLVDRCAAGASARGIAGLDDKIGNNAVEGGVGVVAVEAVLEEVLAGERRLFGEEGDVDGSDGGLEGS